MKSTQIITTTATVVAYGALATTRLPSSSSFWALAMIALTLLGLGSFAADMLPRGWVHARKGVVGSLLLLLATPVPKTSTAVALPDWVVAILALAAMHLNSLSALDRAPEVAGAVKADSRRREFYRRLPFACVLTLLIAAPWLLSHVVADRVHHAMELGGAMWPVVPLLLLAGTIASAAFLRPSTLRRNRQSEQSSPEASI